METYTKPGTVIDMNEDDVIVDVGGTHHPLRYWSVPEAADIGSSVVVTFTVGPTCGWGGRSSVKLADIAAYAELV